MIDMDNYLPMMSDSTLSTKIRVLGLSGFLVILGTTFAIYMASDQEIYLLLIVFMLLVSYGIYLMFYYLI
jgi:hypothetical protein